MNLRGLMDVRAWPDLALEALLRLGGTGAVAPSRWPLPRSVATRVQIRWPSTYRWVHTPRWGDQLFDMLRRRVPVVLADVPQPYAGYITCEFRIDERTYPVAFNTSDYPDYVDEQCTRDSLVTFKLQFLEQGYGDPRIVPGGYLPGSRVLYSMLRYLRWSKDRLRPHFDVYGRFSMNFSQDVRGETLRRLSQTTMFDFYGGDRLVRYSRYLREVARSQICIDLPGQGPLCFRLVEYLAIGSTIVARPHGVRFQGPFVDGIHVVWSSESDVVDRCRMLLEDDARQRAMVAATREFFDQYLHRDQLSAYYLAVVLAAAGVRPDA